MKKIVLFLTILISSLAFASEAGQDLRFNICQVVHKAKVEIKKKTGYYTEAIMWTDVDAAEDGSESVYSVYLEPEIPLVFYTMSTGPKVRPCVSIDEGEEVCGKPGRIVIMQFMAKEYGKHLLMIKGVGPGKGLQCSYLTYLWKGDSKVMKLQEEYEDPYFWLGRGYKVYHPRDYPDPEY
jgi:hypothetical protein